MYKYLILKNIKCKKTHNFKIMSMSLLPNNMPVKANVTAAKKHAC